MRGGGQHEERKKETAKSASARREQSGAVKKVPVELLPAVRAERLALALNIALTAWTNRQGGKGAVGEGRTAVIHNPHGDTVGKLFIGRGKPQQFVGGPFKAVTELFQGIDGRGGLSSGNGTEISGADVAKLGSGLVGKPAGVTDGENGGGELLGEHDVSPLSV